MDGIRDGMDPSDVQAVLAFDQVVDWLQHFEALEDPRQAGKVFYPLDEILLLTLMAVLAGTLLLHRRWR